MLPSLLTDTLAELETKVVVISSPENEGHVAGSVRVTALPGIRLCIS